MNLSTTFNYAPALLFCIGACACSRSAGRDDQATGSAGEVHAAATASVGRSCSLPAQGGSDPRTLAVRCAERFVTNNGYTDVEPSADSIQWVGELLDSGPAAATLAARRNTLQRHAAVVCKDLELGPVYLVGFRGGSAGRGGGRDRLVMMDTQFRSVHINHQSTNVDELLRHRDCTPVPTKGSEAGQ